jgi:hypothetical protein
MDDLEAGSEEDSPVWKDGGSGSSVAGSLEYPFGTGDGAILVHSGVQLVLQPLRADCMELVSVSSSEA